MVTRSCKHLSNRSKYFKVLKLIELYYLTYKRGNMTQLLGHANICSKGHCFGQLFFERWPAKVDDRVVSWKLLIGWLAFDDNSDWLWLAVDEAYLDNGQFWQGYTLSYRTSRFFLPRLVIQLSPNINKARSAPSGIVNITSAQSLLQSSEVSLRLRPAVLMGNWVRCIDWRMQHKATTTDVDAWEDPCCSRHVVITQRGRLHQSGNRLKEFLLQFL